MWDRRGFARYQLPLATGLWQSQCLRLSDKLNETVWVQPDAASGVPIDVFTLGTVPAPHRKGLPESTVTMYKIFHDCWGNFAKETGKKNRIWEEQEEESEEEEQDEPESEEEEEGEEATEEDEEESERWLPKRPAPTWWLIMEPMMDGHWMDDRPTPGCLWMDLHHELTQNSQWEDYVQHAYVFKGERFPSFADMWMFLMQAPCRLADFEGWYRMEAARFNGHPLPAHIPGPYWDPGWDGTGLVLVPMQDVDVCGEAQTRQPAVRAMQSGSVEESKDVGDSKSMAAHKSAQRAESRAAEERRDASLDSDDELVRFEWDDDLEIWDPSSPEFLSSLGSDSDSGEIKEDESDAKEDAVDESEELEEPPSEDAGYSELVASGLVDGCLDEEPLDVETDEEPLDVETPERKSGAPLRFHRGRWRTEAAILSDGSPSDSSDGSQSDVFEDPDACGYWNL